VTLRNATAPTTPDNPRLRHLTGTGYVGQVGGSYGLASLRLAQHPSLRIALRAVREPRPTKSGWRARQRSRGGDPSASQARQRSRGGDPSASQARQRSRGGAGFWVETGLKTQQFSSRIVSDPLAKENALERDHLHSAVGNCWERYLYSLRRV
jgi:hypothetical protein